MKKASQIYREELKDRSRAESLAKSVGIENSIDAIDKMYDLASGTIGHKWDIGEKTPRTDHIRKAMGKDYPDSALIASTFTDTVVAGLDELLDQDLEKAERLSYVMTEVASIGKLVGNDLGLTRKQRDVIGKYFYDTIMMIAGMEVNYSNLVRNIENEDKFLKLAKEFYGSRAAVMDVFIQLPLIELDYDMRKKEVKNIIEVARRNRAIGMNRKDIYDRQIDIKNNTRTPYTEQKGKKLRCYGRKLANEFLEELNSYKFKDTKLQKFKNNFYKMSQEEIRRI